MRWVSTSSSSASYKCSWWGSSSSWSPVVSYYDTSLGTNQEHEAILPRGCKLSQQFSPPSVEVQYCGKHVRISDERYINPNVYSGYTFCVFFTIGAIFSFLSFIIYVMI